jgi:hypothetical protein
VLLLIGMAMLLWRSTRIPVDPNAHDEGPNIQGGTRMPPYDQ